MYNWSHIDEEAMKRQDPEKYRRWRLVQMINYDLQGEKLDRKEVMELWPQISEEIDPYRRRVMEFLLWGKRYSLPTNLRWWNAPRTISR
ncbi:hypothetical protein HY409_04315 [Candidatus Gottesmanbacteria bacterium]|nr:hypothetical protein [Candidatus Gottesmanbacteria bacterium]